MYRLREKPRGRAHRYLVAGLVLLVLAAAAAGIFLAAQPSTKPQPADVITYSTDRPVEEKPATDYQWRGAAEDPKYIAISSIDAEGYVQSVGVDQHREIATPNNIHMAGWFVESVRPGQKGLAIIDGHLNGRLNDGIFRRLGSVKPGAKIVITFGSGEKKTFRVKTVSTVPAKDAAAVLFSQDPKVTSQLNLITCTGTFDWESRKYADRVIVTAELID